SLFPSETWRRLVARELRSGAGSDSGYGHVAGHAGLREAIARRIAVSRGVQAAAADLTVTNGAQQALDLPARVPVTPGDTAALRRRSGRRCPRRRRRLDRRLPAGSGANRPRDSVAAVSSGSNDQHAPPHVAAGSGTENA